MDIKELIDHLDGPAAFGKELLISRHVAFDWRAKNMIPARYWGRVIRLARRKNVTGFTAAHMVWLAEYDDLEKLNE